MACTLHQIWQLFRYRNTFRVSIFITVVITSQERDLFLVGQYVGMSILQGCGGFPFLSDGVFKYLTTGEALGVNVKNGDIVDGTVRFVINKVIY